MSGFYPPAGLTGPLPGMPPAGTRILRAGGEPCGAVTPAAFRWLQAAGLDRFFKEAGRGLTLKGGAAPGEAEAVLEEFALACSGILPRFHRELLDVRHGGRTLFRARRGIVRILGFSTRCVHAVGITPDGRIAASLRSRTKPVNPGKWDTLAGGLASAGEPLDVSMAREIGEEAGLGPESYRMGEGVRIGRLAKELPEGWMSEEAWAFPVMLDEGAEPRPFDGEAERIELLPAGEIRRLLEERAFVAGAAMSLMAICPELEAAQPAKG